MILTDVGKAKGYSIFLFSLGGKREVLIGKKKTKTKHNKEKAEGKMRTSGDAEWLLHRETTGIFLLSVKAKGKEGLGPVNSQIS